jgi:hypothetical protein
MRAYGQIHARPDKQSHLASDGRAMEPVCGSVHEPELGGTATLPNRGGAGDPAPIGLQLQRPTFKNSRDCISWSESIPRVRTTQARNPSKGGIMRGALPRDVAPNASLRRSPSRRRVESPASEHPLPEELVVVAIPPMPPGRAEPRYRSFSTHRPSGRLVEAERLTTPGLPHLSAADFGANNNV